MPKDNAQGLPEMDIEGHPRASGGDAEGQHPGLLRGMLKANTRGF
jgi:hypothetical protein